MNLDSFPLRGIRVPASVLAAVGVLILLQLLDTMALWSEAASPRGLLTLGLRALLAVGLLTHRRVAWMLVRTIGLGVAILNPLLHANDLVRDNGLSAGATIYVTLGSALLVGAWWLLGRSSAIAFFGLRCPRCGRDAARLTEAGRPCRGCGYAW